MKDFIIAVIAIALVGNLFFNKDVKENFWMLSAPRKIKVDKQVHISEPENKYQADMYSVPPNYQSMLAPRFGNVDYGAYIRYNLPNQSNLGVPSNPLGVGPNQLADLPSAGLPSCNQSVETYEPIGNRPQAMIKKRENIQRMADEGMIPANNQPDVSVQSAAGVVTQPIVYDRFVYANQRSRLYGQGDPIRGDIGCIVPIQDAWFRPSVQPNIDLRAGAMTVMGGINNETPNELRALQSVYSHGINSQDSYAQIAHPAMAQKDMYVGQAQSALEVTAFP